MAENYWEQEYNEAAQSESSQGGIVAQCLVSAGFKTYSSGVNPADDFFPFSKAEDKDKAKSKAKAFSDKHNGKGAKFGIGIVCYKAGALSKGEPVTWKNDRVFFYDDFTEACKVVLKPALSKLGIKPGKAWLRIAFKDDPYGGKEDDGQGGQRTKQVAYPVQVFKSEAEAHAAAKATNGNGKAESKEEQQEGGVPAWLVKLKPKLEKARAEGQSDEQIANDYGTTEEAVKAVLA